MPVTELFYPGYWDDRRLMGFRQSTRLIPEMISMKAQTLALKMAEEGDASRAAAIAAAAARLIDMHGNPKPVHDVPVGVPKGVPDPGPVGSGAPEGAAEPAANIDLKPYTAGDYSPPGLQDVTPLPDTPAGKDLPMGSLLGDFPRGKPTVKRGEADPGGQAPAAMFRATENIRRDALCAWQPSRFFLGLVDGSVTTAPDGSTFIAGGHQVGVSDDRHVCTFAGSRAGKGRSAIVPQLLHYRGSVLAIDPKAELATITARQRVALGQTVHVLDPFGIAQGYPRHAGLVTGFNPIAAMRLKALVEDAALIADALVMEEGGRDPHWNDSARSFIEGLVLHVRTHPRYAKRRTLVMVRLLAGQGIATDSTEAGAGLKALIAEMKGNAHDASGVVRTAAADYEERPAGEQGSMLSTVRRHLKWIDLFRDPGNPFGPLTLEHHGFDLSDLKTKATTVYLCLPARHIGTCGRWLRLFINLMLQAMEITRKSRLPGDAPVLCVLDEFASLGYMKQIEDAAAQIAGFGVKLWTVLQDIGQLKALYGDRWETFIANSGILQFFGNSDMTTLEWVSKRLGTTLVQVVGRNTGRTDSQDKLTDLSRSALYELMTPEEIARFFGRGQKQSLQLVIWAGDSAPFMVLQRACYDLHGLGRHPDSGLPLFDLIR